MKMSEKKTTAPANAAAKAPAKKAPAKAPAKKAPAKAPAKKPEKKLDIIIQSPLGGEITPEQIAAKLPKEARDVYVRVDENKLYWVGTEGVGNVDIWE